MDTSWIICEALPRMEEQAPCEESVYRFRLRPQSRITIVIPRQKVPKDRKTIHRLNDRLTPDQRPAPATSTPVSFVL